MSTCCSCCASGKGCKHQYSYFIVAVLLWAYALATLLIPADFPLQIGSIKSVLIMPSLASIVFTAVFVVVNIIIGALANSICNKKLAANPGDYLLTKLRNAFVAAFGFVAFLRIIIFLEWIVGYTA